MGRAQVDALRSLVKDVLMPAYNDFDRRASDELRDAITQDVGGASQELVAKGRLRKVDQERRVLLALLVHLREDERLLDGRLDEMSTIGLERVYEQIRAFVPPSVWKLYTQTPSEGEAAELWSLSDPRASSSSQRTNTAPKMQCHRERGQLPVAMATLAKLIISPLCHVVSFAIPSEAALALIAEHAPLIECGAGTGYWSALLQQRGVDVIAYDSQPPTRNSTNNHFFSGTAFCDVRAGSGGDMFEASGSGGGGSGGDDCGAHNAARALLLVWPNNPDEVDNAHLRAASGAAPKPPLWDSDCLRAFHSAGGATVVFVGEREEVVRGTLAAGALPECGSSASRRFQAMLSEHFEQVRQMAIPNWAYNSDDLTVWTRREASALA